jgi:hypothetical protein
VEGIYKQHYNGNRENYTKQHAKHRRRRRKTTPENMTMSNALKKMPFMNG